MVLIKEPEWQNIYDNHRKGSSIKWKKKDLMIRFPRNETATDDIVDDMMCRIHGGLLIKRLWGSQCLSKEFWGDSKTSKASELRNMRRRRFITSCHRLQRATLRIESRKSIQLSVNPIIKRNIVSLNEMWNQQSLMLIDPCSMWSRALKHLSRYQPFFTRVRLLFRLLLRSADDNENKSCEATPTIRDKCTKLDTRSSANTCRSHGIASPGSLFDCEHREPVCVAVPLMNGSKIRFFFFFSRFVNYYIASLSQRSFRAVQWKASFSFVWTSRRSTESLFACSCYRRSVEIFGGEKKFVILMLREENCFYFS